MTMIESELYQIIITEKDKNILSTMEMTDEEIRRNYKNAKYKVNQIKVLAELNLCSKNKIKTIVGFEQENSGKSTRYVLDNDKLLKLYQAKFSDNQMANKIGCCSEVIHNWRKANGLPSNYTFKKIIPVKEIREQLIKGLSTTSISSKLKVSVSTVRRVKYKYDIMPQLSESRG